MTGGYGLFWQWVHTMGSQAGFPRGRGWSLSTAAKKSSGYMGWRKQCLQPYLVGVILFFKKVGKYTYKFTFAYIKKNQQQQWRDEPESWFLLPSANLSRGECWTRNPGSSHSCIKTSWGKAFPGGGLGQVWGLEGKGRCWGAPLWGLICTAVGTGRRAELIHLHLFIP